MCRPLRRLHASFRVLNTSATNPLAVCQRAQANRRCIQALAQKRPDVRTPLRASQRQVVRPSDEGDLRLGDASHESLEHEEESSSRKDAEQDSQFAEHLNGLFSPLQFPPELSRRILTHGSHPAAVHGHNAGLSFMGRRVLETYLLLFLNSSRSLKHDHDLEHIASRTLNTYVLGEHIGAHWGLGRMLRWTPTVPAEKLKMVESDPSVLRNVGLYKVQGDTVAAVMGGIFQQFGGSVAHRIFHTRVLPHLARQADVLPTPFHGDVFAVAKRMGGVDGPLIVKPDASKSTLRLSQTA
ncbi:hypothetical protein BDN72DRAFT_848972 [Pluteus cervinus]|uniref:Uncharacterized protein n=1 Tax=Pluteus cervinus TaxID=181527 RepID=A0ACD3A9T1_9AGAR|nr:hypothetical protein BDN72DRAFT_848972 [Pluteus cervinus]